MTVPFKINRLPVKQIDLEDDTYNLLPFRDDLLDENLVSRIRRFGLLHPPIVKEENDGLFVVAAGRKRLQIVSDACQQTCCDCLIIPKTENELETLAIALEDALISHPLSPIQKAVFFQKALQFIDEEGAALRFLPLMDIAPHSYHIKKLISIVALEEPIARAVHDGSLSEKSAYEFSTLSFRDRLAIFDIISTLKLSVGNQKKFISLCKDLAKRESSSILAIIGNPELNEIINHPDANIPQKSANMMSWLINRFSPRSSDAAKQFSRQVAGLNLPAWAAVEHSPNFERDEVILSLKFADFQELEKKWQDISKLI